MSSSNISNIISSFENKVFNGVLEAIDWKKDANILPTFGLAVSGGADSISLLYSFVHLFGKSHNLEVITVNHFIRPEVESAGDAAFVEKTCNDLRLAGANVNCTVVELGEGQVFNVARQRQAGIEEAARFLRYKAFDDFIHEKKIDFLCLAHNKNDNLETILMRFLQGSNVDGSAGIKIKRNKIIRPLINITRDEIEQYLVSQNLSWRDDKTNNDTNYFRNNIRHNLVPFLNMHFGGWEKAVLSGAEKAGEDCDVINKCVLRVPMEMEWGDLGEINKIIIKTDDFVKEKIGVQKRVLTKACNLIGENGRIPNDFLNDVLKSFYENMGGKGFSKIFGLTEISFKKNNIFIKKYIKKDTDLVFFDIIEEDGVYDFPFGKLSVTFSDSRVYFSINGCESVINCNYPVCIRSYHQGDEIKNSLGMMKKVADILSDWHVVNSDKNLIPVVYNLKDGAENIKCVLGSFLGYKDWIVK